MCSLEASEHDPLVLMYDPEHPEHDAVRCHADCGKVEQLVLVHDCLHDLEASMSFVAHFGAPGKGSLYRCECGRAWAKVGDDYFDPSEGRHIGTLADFA